MSQISERPAVLLLNFGEPSSPALDEVVPFLERIFTANARLEPDADPGVIQARSRVLARRRGPGLVRAYETIGGSPLRQQAIDQGSGLTRALEARGASVPVEVGMQFTEPSIEEAVGRLLTTDPSVLVALPVYPLCGPSTTVAALTEVSATLARLERRLEVREISGWHRHPGYVALRREATRGAAIAAGLDLDDPAVRLAFSAHGTPLQYVRDGSRYVEYVEEWCAVQGRSLGLERWTLGYQNHSNRGIEWTRPAIETALEDLEGVTDVLVDPISFMHEQSETLMELDVDLAERASELGLAFHRVPVPHDDPAFSDVLADLVLVALGKTVDGLPDLASCRCRPGALCFNGEPAAPLLGVGSTP